MTQNEFYRSKGHDAVTSFTTSTGYKTKIPGEPEVYTTQGFAELAADYPADVKIVTPANEDMGGKVKSDKMFSGAEVSEFVLLGLPSVKKGK